MFVKKLQNFIFHEKLFSRGDGILIGASGGPDSTCLALVLSELREKYNLKISLVHVNYGLRGDDSEDEEKFVKEFAGERELELKVVRFKKKEGDRNLEEEMRDFRYSVFEKEREKKDLDWIAVGHNIDDQAETFFLNLFRGAGIAGLGGMRSKREKVIRPLLNFSKKEILEFLGERKQDFRIDKTNFRLEFSRNKIRQELVPLIEKKYSPQIKSRISNLAENLRDANKIIEKKVEEKFAEVASVLKGGEIEIDVKKFLSLKKSLQGFVFRKAVEELKGDLKNISKSNFFEFMKIVKSEKGKNQKMKIGEVEVKRRGKKIFLEIL